MRCRRCKTEFDYDTYNGICPKCCAYNRQDERDEMDLFRKDDGTMPVFDNVEDYIPPQMSEEHEELHKKYDNRSAKPHARQRQTYTRTQTGSASYGYGGKKKSGKGKGVFFGIMFALIFASMSFGFFEEMITDVIDEVHFSEEVNLDDFEFEPDLPEVEVPAVPDWDEEVQDILDDAVEETDIPEVDWIPLTEEPVKNLTIATNHGSYEFTGAYNTNREPGEDGKKIVELAIGNLNDISLDERYFVSVPYVEAGDGYGLAEEDAGEYYTDDEKWASRIALLDSDTTSLHYKVGEYTEVLNAYMDVYDENGYLVAIYGFQLEIQ